MITPTILTIETASAAELAVENELTGETIPKVEKKLLEQILAEMTPTRDSTGTTREEEEVGTATMTAIATATAADTTTAAATRGETSEAATIIIVEREILEGIEMTIRLIEDTRTTIMATAVITVAVEVTTVVVVVIVAVVEMEAAETTVAIDTAIEALVIETETTTGTETETAAGIIAERVKELKFMEILTTANLLLVKIVKTEIMRKPAGLESESEGANERGAEVTAETTIAI